MCGRGGVPRDAVLMGAPRGPAKREGKPGEQHQSKNWKRVPGRNICQGVKKVYVIYVVTWRYSVKINN